MTVPKDNTEEIAFLLMQIAELQTTLENCHTAIMGIQDPEVQKTYAEETIPLTDEYELLMGLLEEAFLNHFKWERETNQPVNFAFRKTYKQLVKN